MISVSKLTMTGTAGRPRFSTLPYDDSPDGEDDSDDKDDDDKPSASFFPTGGIEKRFKSHGTGIPGGKPTGIPSGISTRFPTGAPTGFHTGAPSAGFPSSFVSAPGAARPTGGNGVFGKPIDEERTPENKDETEEPTSTSASANEKRAISTTLQTFPIATASSASHADLASMVAGGKSGATRPTGSFEIGELASLIGGKSGAVVPTGFFTGLPTGMPTGMPNHGGKPFGTGSISMPSFAMPTGTGAKTFPHPTGAVPSGASASAASTGGRWSGLFGGA